MAHLPCPDGRPWRELARFGDTSPSFMVSVGFKILRRGLKSGWLSQEELLAGARPLAIEFARICSNALNRAGKGYEEAQDASAAIAEIYQAARARGAQRPKSQTSDMDLRQSLMGALTNGRSIQELQPAFDLMDLSWEKKISAIAARAIKEASDEKPLNAAAQPAAALEALRGSFVGSMMRSQRPEAIKELGSRGLLDDCVITVWRQIENPLKARRHWVEAHEAAGRPVDMSKRFANLRSNIEACDAPEEQKGQWLSWLEQTPAAMPAESRINLPFKERLSAGALAFAMIAIGEQGRSAAGSGALGGRGGFGASAQPSGDVFWLKRL